MTIVKRILKITAYVLSSILVLVLIVAGFTQTPYFQDRLRTIIISNLSTQINGSLYLGTVRGSFITGFSIDSVALLRGSDIVISANNVTVQYDPIPFFEKRLQINYLIVQQPVIHLQRSRKGEWNITQLFKSSDTARGGAFEWPVRVGDFELKRSTLTLVDSLSLTAGDHDLSTDSSLFEYHNFTVNDFNLTASGIVERNRCEAHVSHISFYSNHPEFELTQFSGDFAVTSAGAAAKGVVLKTTRSNLELEASMRGLNLFRGIELQGMGRDSSTLRLRANDVDLRELKAFIPQLDFVDGSVHLECDAEGEFGNLTVSRLNLHTLQTSINAGGTLSNLHRPEKLFLNVFATDTRINPADISKILPGLKLPDFKRLHTTSLALEFTGTPRNFKTKLDAVGGSGDLHVEGGMNLEQTLPQYQCSFVTKRLNLGEVLSNEKLKTLLFTSGTLEGNGLTAETIDATLALNIDPSNAQNITSAGGQLHAHAIRRRIEITSSLAALNMNATIDGFADFSDEDKPSFGGNVAFSSFDLAKILDDPEQSSDLTLRANGSGSGRTIDDISGKLTLSLLASTFQGRSLSPLEMDFTLDQQNPSKKRLSMESSLADIEFNGRFDLDVAVAALANLSSNLLYTIREHASPPEMVASHMRAEPVRIPSHTSSQRVMDFSYRMNIYDLEPLSSYLGGREFNARGTLSGALRGSEDLLTLSADGDIEEFFLGTLNDGMFLDNMTVSLVATDLSPSRTLETLATTINLRLGSGLFNAKTLSSAHATLEYNQLRGKITFTGVVDSLYNISFGGEASIQPNTYAFDLDSLNIGMGDYVWRNDEDIQTRLNYDGFRVMHAVMKRDKESLAFTGAMKHSGEIDFDGTLQKYDLEGLNILLKDPALKPQGGGFSGTLDARVKLSGTTEAPAITLNAQIDSTYFKQTRVGTVAATITYADRSASIDVKVNESPNVQHPSLTIQGRLPIDLAFNGVEERFPDQQQQLSIVSEGFDLGVLDPLIDDLENLNGTLRCNVTVQGTPRDPAYSGWISLTNVQCIFGPNNVTYLLDGELEPSKDKILLKNIVVKSPQPEQRKSDARFTGSLTIKDFQVVTFDITAYGQLLLMTPATRKVIPTFYGTLVTEIGPQGLNLKGSPQRPVLSGSLSILNADLEYPPTVSSGNVRGQMLNYLAIGDTAHETQPSGVFSSKFYRTSDTLAVTTKRLRHIAEPSFVDRLRYDLNIETKGTTSIKMIFTSSPTTNEELYTELDGKVSAVNDDGTAKIYGNITVLPRSYYNFFRRFDATGTLRFVGPWDNPVLDIDAVYEGYTHITHRTSGQSGTEEEQKNTEQKVIVELKIGGTRYEPKLTMNLKVQEPGKDATDWASRGGDVQSDAISFILTGKFRDDLTSGERENIATNLGSAGVSGLTSSLLSGMLSQYLREEFPFIRNAEFNYQGGGNFQESANLRISGEAFEGYWRFGGRIFNDIGNANVSYQLSIGNMVKSLSLRNLFIEYEHKVEGSDLTADKKLSNNARLYYRFSF